MRAISLHQPHATFIALGLKPFETRHWATRYRGPLLIHAAKRRMTWGDCRLCERIFDLAMEKGVPGLEENLPLGAFVCMVDLVDCWPVERLTMDNLTESNDLGDFSKGRFAWKLRNVRRIVWPVAARGRQRFWDFNLLKVPILDLQPMEQIIL